MGFDAHCTLILDGRRFEGKAHLEPTELTFQGTERVRIPLSAIRAATPRKGQLLVESTLGTFVFDLGRDAEAWALKIRYPKGRLDKLGVKADSVVSMLGVTDETLADEVKARTPHVSVGRAKKASMLVFFGVKSTRDLDKLESLRSTITPDGAIWALWPKGRKELREDDVRRAAKAMGLVDVKVVSVSDELSGLKLVIPVAQRKAR
jgi:hypothetical protein